MLHRDLTRLFRRSTYIAYDVDYSIAFLHGDSPMPDKHKIFRDAVSLEPADRLRLIARLWASLPADHWAAPTAAERKEIEHRLAANDSDALADASWRMADRILAERRAADRLHSIGSRVYGAPRRFDLATIFAVTSSYALLFGGLSLLFSEFGAPGAYPIVSGVIGGFITIVGIGQAVLFGGTKPRQASFLVGGVLTVLICIGSWILSPRLYPAPVILFMLGFAVVGGVILGYCAGGLVGGVFLFADLIRGRFGRSSPAPPSAEQHPLDAG